MVKDVTERIVFSGSRGHQKNQVAEDGGLSVVEWLRGIGLEHDRDLIRRAAIEYDNKMAFLLQDEFHPTDFYSTGWQNLLVTPDDPEPVLVDDKEQNGALATAEDQQETTQAAGSFAADKLAVVAGANPGMRTTRTSLGAANAAEGAKSTQHDTHDNAAIRVRVLRALELIRRNGLAAEATRIRLNRKLQEIEKSLTLLYGTGCVGGARKSMKVGRNYLGGGGSRLRTNPIQEWLEGIDERMASKYVRILSRTFAYLEDVDETAVFWLEQAGCKTYDEDTKAAADASPLSFTSMEEKLGMEKEMQKLLASEMFRTAVKKVMQEEGAMQKVASFDAQGAGSECNKNCNHEAVCASRPKVVKVPWKVCKKVPGKNKKKVMKKK
eukprot:g4191.t1